MKKNILFIALLTHLLSSEIIAQENSPQVFAPKTEHPLVTNLSALHQPKQGLQGRHIVLWQSHGWYYERRLDRWEWQRVRLMQTVEDLYTQSYVLPFLVPMLENAGANVLIPRERDWNTNEIIVDNDANTFYPQAKYIEQSGIKKWKTIDSIGFAHLRSIYVDNQNPFKEGTFKYATSITKGKESTITWLPEVKESGRYAVYIAYHTMPGSTSGATYTIRHKGGTTRLKVNQQMGGGTWIYLGTFTFDKDAHQQHGVTLSNITDKAGEIVTADAVKFGGGMGNIGRPRISTYPRFTEAARYWMQWAGVPDSVYSESKGMNDYTDDYKGRGLWVNWLAGGSEAYPEGKGLNIPIDMAFAFHTDAGTTKNNDIIGTLGIYDTKMYDGLLGNGAPRILSKELTETIHSSIVGDIRRLYEPQWKSRGNRDASYFEAKTPRVPTMLLELLSHQNFADMRYGLDPRFRFHVSRAIYKGMLKFICQQHNEDYVVAPLPVDHLSARITHENRVELTWRAVIDTLEETATPRKYIVYTRYGNGEFDNGILTNKEKYIADIPADVVCSFKVVAVNKGGKSFPSEILAVGRSSKPNAPKALIVNGFDRISAPADFVAPMPLDTLYAGFLDNVDHGVPYIQDISYTGSMKEFNRSLPWVDDDAGGFGDSYGNEETKVIAGNTFDYPALHGEAILKAGYSFESCSNESFTEANKNYAFVDYILGKQCQTKMGRGGVTPLAFKTFSDKVQEVLTQYTQQGTSLFISGAFVATDLWNNPLAPTQKKDTNFATNILKYKWRNSRAAINGQVNIVNSPFNLKEDRLEYANKLNANTYIVESPDAIEPATEEAYTVMRYAENNLSASVAYKGKYKTFIMGFPFEAIKEAMQREKLMKEIISFFEKE